MASGEQGGVEPISSFVFADGLIGSVHRWGQWTLTIWTRSVDGDTRTVSLGLRPWPSERVIARGSDDMRALSQELIREGERLRESIGDGPWPDLSAVALRSLPLRAALSERGLDSTSGLDVDPNAGRVWRNLGIDEGVTSGVEITTDDLPALPYVGDAYLFDKALQAADPHPMSFIERYISSDEQKVSLRTVQSRVATARKLGLLSQTSPGKVSGRLTTKGQKLVRAMQELTRMYDDATTTDDERTESSDHA